MTETTSPFPGNYGPQAYVVASALTYYWDVATLEFVKGTQPGSGGGGAVTIADGADVAQGTKADAAWVSGDGTVISLLKTIASPSGGGLTDVQLRAVAVPVSAAALPLPAGAATLAGQTQPGVDIGDVTINNVAGASAVNIQDGGNSITVDAATLPLPTGASTAALQTQPGVDIGDVTVNNAAGASAVNIQDGGNSITVDGPLTDVQLRATPVPVSGTVVANPTGYITRLEEASATITYVGSAVPGTVTSAASWSIKRMDSTSGLVVLWGAGTAAFNQIWDNRAALAYS